MIVKKKTVAMSEEATEKIISAEQAAAGDDDDDEEDLETLQKEIERMEAEAARITKETEELEKKKDAKIAATGNGTASGDSGGAKKGDGQSRDGYVGLASHAWQATTHERTHSFLKRLDAFFGISRNPSLGCGAG